MQRARAGLLLLAWFGLLPLRADYLTNTDFKDSLGGWHGNGERVLLLPDGSEGADTDADATPVIKLKLGSERESVYQEYEIRDQPASVTITVDVYASSDYQPGSDYQGFRDFWFRDEPDFYERLGHPKPGQWITVTATVQRLRGTDHVLTFNVPPAGLVGTIDINRGGLVGVVGKDRIFAACEWVIAKDYRLAFGDESAHYAKRNWKALAKLRHRIEEADPTFYNGLWSLHCFSESLVKPSTRSPSKGLVRALPVICPRLILPKLIPKESSFS